MLMTDCDPKIDSTITLVSRGIPAIMAFIQCYRRTFNGYKDVQCIH